MAEKKPILGSGEEPRQEEERTKHSLEDDGELQVERRKFFRTLGRGLTGVVVVTSGAGGVLGLTSREVLAAGCGTSQGGSPETFEQDTDCAQNPADLDCGKLQSGPQTQHQDNDCGIGFNQDGDCGSYSGATSYHRDNDCVAGTPYADNDCGKKEPNEPLPNVVTDNDCGTYYEAGVFQDNDCGIPNTASSTDDHDCGHSDPIQSTIAHTDNDCSADIQDLDCGTRDDGSPGVYHQDEDCIEAGSSKAGDSDCGKPKIGMEEWANNDPE